NESMLFDVTPYVRRNLHSGGDRKRQSIEFVLIGLVDCRTRSESMRVHLMTDEPFDLDKHRGMAAQKATDLRRVLAEVESNARELRDRQAHLETQLLSVPAASWPEAAAKARYVLGLYVADLSGEYTRHRSLVAAILDDFTRLARDV